MRGIRVEATGGPEVLRLAELAEPAPGAGEVLVRVAAAGLNYIDTYHRGGLYPMPLPFTPGMEGAGTVVALGEGVTRLAVGDRVAWASAIGSYAESVCVREDLAFDVPDGVDLELAAAVVLQGFTAHFLVSDTFPLGPGHRCLVHAGAGGVGLLLVQMAKRRGAEVFTTVGSPDKVELVTAAGADHVILYRDVEFGAAVEAIAGRKALDVVYDGVGRAVFDRSLDLLRPRGTMVNFGNASGAVEPLAPLRLMQGGSLFLTRPSLYDHLTTQEERARRSGDVFGWIAAGELDVRIGARLPLADAAEAHRLLEGRATTGKVLLLP
jgi:NADPH2:quinone reductase